MPPPPLLAYTGLLQYMEQLHVLAAMHCTSVGRLTLSSSNARHSSSSWNIVRRCRKQPRAFSMSAAKLLPWNSCSGASAKYSVKGKSACATHPQYLLYALYLYTSEPIHRITCSGCRLCVSVCTDWTEGSADDQKEDRIVDKHPATWKSHCTHSCFALSCLVQSWLVSFRPQDDNGHVCTGLQSVTESMQLSWSCLENVDSVWPAFYLKSAAPAGQSIIPHLHSCNMKRGIAGSQSKFQAKCRPSAASHLSLGKV